MSFARAFAGRRFFGFANGVSFRALDAASSLDGCRIGSSRWRLCPAGAVSSHVSEAIVLVASGALGALSGPVSLFSASEAWTVGRDRLVVWVFAVAVFRCVSFTSVEGASSCWLPLLPFVLVGLEFPAYDLGIPILVWDPGFQCRLVLVDFVFYFPLAGSLRVRIC